MAKEEMTRTIPIPIRIHGHLISPDAPPFIVAEMSGNHNHSLERALAIVDAAAQSGAHALKLQTYTADTMTLDLAHGEFMVRGALKLWKGRSLYKLYQQAATPWEWHKPIFARCRKHRMLAFSTPFDDTAVDLLESLGVPLYKIASFELTDLPLIRRVARTGKPLILSTGMATVGEIHESVTAARESGARQIILLKCTSSYPASPENSNLLTIPHMRDLFGCQVGISDHTLGIGAALAAVTLGATLIEKHFTLSRADGGVDSVFSLEPDELRGLVVESGRAHQAIGRIFYGPTAKERASLKYRRSIYITKDLKAGELLSTDNIRIIRPGAGLAPKFFPMVLGKAVCHAVKRGTPLHWGILGTPLPDLKQRKNIKRTRAT